MDKTKVGQLLYAEFGDKEFHPSRFSETTMDALKSEIGITESDRSALDALVGKQLQSLGGRAFRLQTGVPGYLEIRWAERSRKAEAFRIVPIDVSESRETDWTSDKLIGVEFPNADMTYTVLLVYSEEGYYVTCPALRGCVSQGNTEEEALENIKEAMTLWLKCEILDARKRTQSELDEELDSAFPAKLVNVKIGGIKV